MGLPRLRLVALLGVTTVRLFADACLGTWVVREFLRQEGPRGVGTIPLLAVSAALAGGLVFLLIRWVARGLPTSVLLAKTCLGAALAAVLLGQAPTPVVFVLLVVSTFIFLQTRDVLLPPAASTGRVTLPRLTGWVDGAGYLAAGGGILLTASRSASEDLWIPELVLCLHMLATAACLTLRFSDAKQDRVRGGALPTWAAGLVFWIGILVLGILVAFGRNGIGFPTAGGVADLNAAAVLPLVGGLALGAFLASVQSHPRRALGLVPLGTFAVLIGLLGEVFSSDPAWWVGILGMGITLVSVPLRAMLFLGGVSREPLLGRGVVLFCLVVAAVLPLLLGLATNSGILTTSSETWVLLAAAVLGSVVALWLLYRELIEQLAEIVLWPIYRIRAYGPGRWSFPAQGPVLVVSNHTAWLDPLWLGKVIPRRLIPMMTSLFYDLPVLRWLMVNVVRAIRVQESGFRREVPELDEAIQALDRGECVVIFPEGRVRRKEEDPLRQFGRGVWRILRQRPQTPVVICWIEGGWGSYFSYLGGPPMKNKPLDRWHRIRIGIGDPEVLASELLEDQRATRTYLRKTCLETRRLIGLEPYLVSALEEKEEEEGEPGIP